MWTVQNPTLRVKIRTEGALSAFGHDRVFDQPVTVTVSAAGELDGATVSVEGDLRRTELVGHATPSDRAEILKRKDREVFNTDVFPTVKFEGAYKKEAGAVSGLLTLHGTSKRVELPVAVGGGAGRMTAEGTLELDLRQFGIKPYKALLGALRVQPFVEVHYSLELVQG